jgi:hypothetical protein
MFLDTYGSVWSNSAPPSTINIAEEEVRHFSVDDHSTE